MLSILILKKTVQKSIASKDIKNHLECRLDVMDVLDVSISDNNSETVSQMGEQVE